MTERRIPVFVCTACAYPSRIFGECDNPACLENPHSNHEVIRAREAAYLKRKAEEEARIAFKKRLRKAGFTTF